MKTDLIDFVEAVYRIEQGAAAWLNGILRAASPILDSGLGLVAYTYDAANPAAVRLGEFASIGMSTAVSASVAESLSLLDPDYVRRSYLALSCATSSEVPGWHAQREALGAPNVGVCDTLVMNGMNPDGQGCLVMSLLPTELRLRTRRRNVLTKLTCHLAAAHRLRRSLAVNVPVSGAAEAIVGHDGRIHHAEGEARSKLALSRLTHAALAISRSRGNLRSREPEQAVDEWKGLIAARWTLVDVNELDGCKYLVARLNRPRAQGRNGLTDREAQVVTFAAMGHHNKLIAYNLGISHSTVRVLISRAAAKLSVCSRQELIRRWSAGEGVRFDRVAVGVGKRSGRSKAELEGGSAARSRPRSAVRR